MQVGDVGKFSIYYMHRRMLNEGQIPEFYDGLRGIDGPGFTADVLPYLGFSIPP